MRKGPSYRIHLSSWQSHRTRNKLAAGMREKNGGRMHPWRARPSFRTDSTFPAFSTSGLTFHSIQLVLLVTCEFDEYLDRKMSINLRFFSISLTNFRFNLHHLMLSGTRNSPQSGGPLWQSTWLGKFDSVGLYLEECCTWVDCNGSPPGGRRGVWTPSTWSTRPHCLDRNWLWACSPCQSCGTERNLMRKFKNWITKTHRFFRCWMLPRQTKCPLTMIPSRVQRASHSSIEWEVNTTDFPVWISSRMTRQSWRRAPGSIPLVGSSKKTMSGSPMRATAVDSFRLLPPE